MFTGTVSVCGPRKDQNLVINFSTQVKYREKVKRDHETDRRQLEIWLVKLQDLKVELPIPKSLSSYTSIENEDDESINKKEFHEVQNEGLGLYIDVGRSDPIRVVLLYCRIVGPNCDLPFEHETVFVR